MRHRGRWDLSTAPPVELGFQAQEGKEGCRGWAPARRGCRPGGGRRRSGPEDPAASEESIPRGANPPATGDKARGLGEGGGAVGVVVDDGDDTGEVGGRGPAGRAKETAVAFGFGWRWAATLGEGAGMRGRAGGGECREDGLAERRQRRQPVGAA